MPKMIQGIGGYYPKCEVAGSGNALIVAAPQSGHCPSARMEFTLTEDQWRSLLKMAVRRCEPSWWLSRAFIERELSKNV